MTQAAHCAREQTGLRVPPRNDGEDAEVLEGAPARFRAGLPIWGGNCGGVKGAWESCEK